MPKARRRRVGPDSDGVPGLAVAVAGAAAPQEQGRGGIVVESTRRQ